MNHIDFMHRVNTNFQAQIYNLKLIFFPRYIYFLHVHINPELLHTMLNRNLNRNVWMQYR